MGTVTREIVRAFSGTLKTVYDEAFAAQAGGNWRRLTTEVDSTQQSEEYGWISELPIMREFVDERVVKSLSESGYTIRNRKWEATIGIDRDVLEDEKHGQIKVRVQSLAEAASMHFDRLVFALIRDNGTGYDGKAFFANDHPVRGGTHDNLGMGALNAETLKAALSAGRRIPLDNGEPMEVAFDTLLVPPELEWTARELLNSAFYPDEVANGTKMAGNVLKGTLSLIVSARLDSAAEWYLFDTSHPVRPFLVQNRIAPEFRALDGSDGETEDSFLRDRYLYGVRARNNAGYGLWQYAYKSSGV